MLNLLTGKLGFIAFIAAFATITILSFTVKYYKGLYDEQVIETAVVTERALNNEANLKNGISAQNDRIKILALKLSKASSVIDISIAKGKEKERKYQIGIQAILKEKKPIGCNNAIRYLNDARGMTWED